MIESALRDELRRAAVEAPDAAPDYAAIWRAGQTRRRRHSVAVVACAAVSVASIVVLVLAATGLFTRSQDAAPTHRSHRQVDGRSQSASSWVASLPVGDQPALPYIDGHTFHDGTVSWPTQDEGYNVLGKVPSGYLVESWPNSDYEWRVGVRDPNGSVTWLNDVGTTAEPLLSTDHAYAAIDDGDGSVTRIYDLQRRTEVAHIESDGFIASVQFLDAGLLYSVNDGLPDARTLLWNPARPNADPVVQHYDPQVVSDDLSRALVSAKSSCWKAIDIVGTDQGDTLYQSCGLQRTYTISPDGAYALTVDLMVVDLANGTTSSFQGAPAHGIVMPVAVWEDNEHVLLTVERTPTRGGWHTNPAIVRCSVVSLECERAVDGQSKNTLKVLDGTRRP